MNSFFPSSFFSRPRGSTPGARPSMRPAAASSAAAAALASALVTAHRLRIRGETFILDDAIHLGQLPQLNAGRSAGEIFLLPHWQHLSGDTLWRPIAKVLWAQLGPDSSFLPWVTVFLAALVVGLLTWFLASRCRIPPAVAALAGLLPMCHPLAADVLLPYVGQMDLMAAAALLAALILMTHPSHAMALAGAACFALALLSKEGVLPALIALPLAVAAVAPSRGLALRKGGRALLLIAAAIAAWFVARMWLFAGAEGALGAGGGWYRDDERRLSQLELLGRYFAAFFDPRTPQTDYSFLKQPGTSAGLFPLVGLVGLAAMVGIIFWVRGRNNTHDEATTDDSPPDPQRWWRVSAAIVWVLVFLLPYLQIVPIGALWAGRFAFLSLLGLAWLVAELITILPLRARAIATAALAVLLLIGAIQINRRAPDWSDATSLWTSEINRRPEHAFAWNNLAAALQLADDPTAGLAAARQATELFPTHGEAWLTRGRLERAVGNDPAGRQSFVRAEELLGDHLDLQMEIARLDASEGHFDIALARLEAIEGIDNPEYEELITRIRKDLMERESLNQD